MLKSQTWRKGYFGEFLLANFLNAVYILFLDLMQVQNRHIYSDNKSNYKWTWYITKKYKLQNHGLIYESLIFNLINYKFCQSNHKSNEITKEILTVYPYIFLRKPVLNS